MDSIINRLEAVTKEIGPIILELHNIMEGQHTLDEWETLSKPWRLIYDAETDLLKSLQCLKIRLQGEAIKDGE